MCESAAVGMLVSYLLGSVPFGWLIARARGVDIRNYGSGNIGATNVLRVVGKPWGIAVFLLDAGKGAAAVILMQKIVGSSAQYSAELAAIVAAAAAVLGHSFPVWLGFRGGKGVATLAGALTAAVPLAAVVIFVVWLAIFYTTRYVSLASIIAALTLPISIAALIWVRQTEGTVLLYFCSALSALVVWRHRSNIARLLRGEEPRFTRK